MTSSLYKKPQCMTDSVCNSCPLKWGNRVSACVFVFGSPEKSVYKQDVTFNLRCVRITDHGTNVKTDYLWINPWLNRQVQLIPVTCQVRGFLGWAGMIFLQSNSAWCPQCFQRSPEQMFEDILTIKSCSCSSQWWPQVKVYVYLVFF